MKTLLYSKKILKTLALTTTLMTFGGQIVSVASPYVYAQEQNSSQQNKAAVSVSTFDELKTALEEDNGVTVVTLANDIELQGGVEIHPNKANIELDLQGHTLVDKNSALITDTIHVSTTGMTNSVTVKNGRVDGKNYYGVIGVPDAKKGVTLQIEDIAYVGPQMIYNINGYAKFSGVNNFTVKDVDSISPVHEFAQISGVTIAGEFNLKHEKNILSTFSFNLIDDGVPYMVIDNDAKVTITNEDDCVFNNANDSLDLIVKPNAEVTINSAGELTDVNGFGDFTVQSNANVTITRMTDKNPSEATIDIDHLLEVNEGASFIVNHDEGIPGDVLNFAKDSVVQINNPKQLELTSQVGKLVTNFPHSGTMELKTESISGWETSTSETPDFAVNEYLDGMFDMEGGKIGRVIYSNVPDILEKMTYNNPHKLLISTPEIVVPAPVLNVVNDRDKQLTGLGEAGATINAYVNGQLLGTTTVGSDKRWTMMINPQVEGTVIEAVQIIDNHESQEVTQTVTHLSDTVNFFKLGYWQPYGLILEGSIDNADYDLTDPENNTKTLSLVDEQGQVVKTFNGQNTDWYDGGIFNGYQAILESDVLNTLEAGKYKVTITLKTTDGIDVTQDLNVGGTTRTIGDYHQNFNEIETNDIGNGKMLSLMNVDGVGYLIIQ